MAFPTPEQLHEVVDPIVEAHGRIVERIKAHRAGPKSAISIAVDGDLDTLELLSKEIGAAFDAAEEAGQLNFGPGYTLEVTTPGVDLPLTAPRHWAKNRGRLVKLPGDGHRVARVGALNAAQDAVILISGKQVEAAELAKVAGAVVEIEFNQPPAAEAELAAADFDTHGVERKTSEH